MNSLNTFRSAMVLLGTLVSIMTLQTSSAKDVASNRAVSSAQYQIDNEQSWLRVLVYRGGLLGALGHNHVVSHHDITGKIALMGEPLYAEIDLELKVAKFIIDDAQLRTIEGDDFPGEVANKDIAATRSNMLGEKLLSADKFPTIKIQSTTSVETLPDIELKATVTVLGRDYPLVVPATVDLSKHSFVATGELSVSHAEIGLSPFKAAFGALRVSDTLALKFELHGTTINQDK